MPLTNFLLVFTLLLYSRLPTATLSGRVATRDGSPVPGVRVELTEGDAHRLLQASTTSTRGEYRLVGLLPGRTVSVEDIRPAPRVPAPGGRRATCAAGQGAGARATAASDV